MYDEQFGFRAGLSADLQLHRLTAAIRDGIKNRSVTVGVFLDLSTAFDTAWHKRLLYKLSVRVWGDGGQPCAGSL